jgi:hypothetical protein
LLIAARIKSVAEILFAFWHHWDPLLLVGT